MAYKRAPALALKLATGALVFLAWTAVEQPPAVDAGDVVSGIASTYGPGYEGFLALPEGPGHRVRVCGPGGCIERVSNDAGPSLAMQRAGRVVDLDVGDFEEVCGCSWRTGLVAVTVEYLDGEQATLPPTDMEGSGGRRQRADEPVVKPGPNVPGAPYPW